MEENQLTIPEEWIEKYLGRLCQIKKGQQLNKLELSDTGTYPCINGGIEPSGYTETYNTEANTITISEGGNSCGYVNYLDKRFWSGGHCYSLINVDKAIRNSFLFHALKGREATIMDLRVGSGLPNIQQKAIKEFPILFPKSTTEQRQIATILFKVDEAITQTQQLIAKYQRIKTGLMQDLLTKGIDENGNIRSEETHEFKDSPLGRIPVEWEAVTLSEISSITSGVTLGKDYPINESIELPYLRVANVQDGYLDLSEVKYVRILKSHISKYKLEKGDVLMNEGGDYDKLGRGTVWNAEIPNCLHQNHVFRIRLNRQELIPDFLSIYSSSNIGKAFFILASKQSTNLASINKTQLKGFRIVKPKLVEQIRIIEFIQNFKQIIERNQSKHLKLLSLKTGLMQDLLSGKVRVNHLIKETESV